MSADDINNAIILVGCGFLWGQWWADRRPKKADDAALTMLADMLDRILEKRKLVGRALTISSTHKFEMLGEKLSIVVQAEGDPEAFIEGEVVK